MNSANPSAPVRNRSVRGESGSSHLGLNRLSLASSTRFSAMRCAVRCPWWALYIAATISPCRTQRSCGPGRVQKFGTSP